MRRSTQLVIVTVVTLFAGCATETVQESDSLEPPTIAFDGAVVSGGLDPALALAWEDARVNPDNGLAYAFSVRTTGLREGARIDLVMARYQGLFVNGIPVTNGDSMVETTTTRADGTATFDPPMVHSGNDWSGVVYAVPADLLCGETLVMARAMDVSGTTVVASAWLVVVTAACP